MIKYTVTVRDKEVTFESNLTNKEALDKLKAGVQSGRIKDTFATDLVAKKTLSQKQWAWVHKIAMQYASPPRPKSASSATKREDPLMKLRRMLGTNTLTPKQEEFALDLVCRSRKGALSEAQMGWVIQLANKSIKQPPQPVMPTHLVNPLTGRNVLVTLERAYEIASRIPRSGIPPEWVGVLKHFESNRSH